MTKNPLYNALLGFSYVALVVTLMSNGSRFAPAEDNILMPMGMLSLFVLSASIMAYIFLYNPLVMFFDGERADAVRLFLKTVVIFAIITVCVLLSSVVFFN